MLLFADFVSSVSSDLPTRGDRFAVLDDGSKVQIPNTCRTLHDNELIRAYQKMIRSESGQPLSESTCHRILRRCNADIKTSLSGVDTFIVEGSQGFDNLENVILEIAKDGGKGEFCPNL
jgi:hypothetical protein